jgi:hypothetical protein
MYVRDYVIQHLYLPMYGPMNHFFEKRDVIFRMTFIQEFEVQRRSNCGHRTLENLEH